MKRKNELLAVTLLAGITLAILGGRGIVSLPSAIIGGISAAIALAFMLVP